MFGKKKKEEAVKKKTESVSGEQKSYEKTTRSVSWQASSYEVSRVQTISGISRSTTTIAQTDSGSAGFFFRNSPTLLPPAPLNEIGYKSPFSRTLKPLGSDAVPFNRNNLITSSLRTPTTTNPSRNLLPMLTVTSPLLNKPTEIPSTVPTYNTNGRRRGKVLVINNMKFLKEQEHRKGAEIDEKNVGSLFKKMGFETNTHRNLKKSEMLAKVKRFTTDSDLKYVDISIVVMMSHGSNIDDTGKIIRGGFTQIYGIDDKGLPIDEILDEFSCDHCKVLAGKPKIFIFQCCRGILGETLHIDAAPMGQKNKIKTHADMLIAFSTLPGFYSIRDTQTGSWYIQSICEVFRDHAKDKNVEEMLKIVDGKLSEKHPEYKQTSTYESRGFKLCYLNPK